jgi:hypothetical protein
MGADPATYTPQPQSHARASAAGFEYSVTVFIPEVAKFAGVWMREVGGKLSVDGFEVENNGSVGALQATGIVKPGDVLVAVNADSSLEDLGDLEDSLADAREVANLPKLGSFLTFTFTRAPSRVSDHEGGLSSVGTSRKLAQIVHRKYF